MSSAPPRPASTLRHAGRHEPERPRAGLRQRWLQAGQPIGERRSRPRVAEVVGRVHGVGEERSRRRPASARDRRPRAGSRAPRAATRCAPRSPRAARVARTRLGSDPSAAGRLRLAGVLVQQRERAVAACPPSRRRRRRAAAASPRSSSSGVSRADRSKAPEATEYAARATACSPASASRSATPASGCQIASARCHARRSASRRGVASAAARCAARRSCADAPEYVAERSSGCRNSTVRRGPTTRPRSSASPSRADVESERSAHVGDEPEVGAADRGDEQDGAALVIQRRQATAERVDDRARHSQRQPGLDALDDVAIGGAELQQRQRIARRSPGAAAERARSVTACPLRPAISARAESRSSPGTVIVGQPAATVVALGAAHAEQDHHRVGREPPRGEDERVRRRRVDQVQVVDDHGDRAVLGVPADEAQHAPRRS